MAAHVLLILYMKTPFLTCLLILALAPMDAAVNYSKPLYGVSDDGVVVSAVAADAFGNTFITGSTRSKVFPVTTPGVVLSTLTPGSCTFVFSPSTGTQSRPCSDAFVIKLDPKGNVLFATYFGGSGEDAGTAIALDSAGNILVAGRTFHEQANSNDFPTTAGAAYRTAGGARQYDAFLIKLNPQGTAVLYSTLIPSTGAGAVFLAVDLDGNAYVAGTTLPTQNAFQPTAGAFQMSGAEGRAHGVIVKVNPAGSAFLYATYLGGDRDDSIYGIAVDSGGNVYVTGDTSSTSFPLTTGVIQSTRASTFSTGFVSKLNPTGSALVYSTYLGTSSFNSGFRIGVDAQGNALVLSRSGNLVKLNQMGSSAVYSRIVDGGNSLAIDPAGNAFVAGTTNSPFQTVTAGASQRCYAGGESDIILTEFDSSGNLVAGSYYGGAARDYSIDLAVAAGGAVSLVGLSIPGGAGTQLPFVANLKLADATQPDLPCMMLTAQNSASLEEGPIAPGELITLRGLGIGPEVGVEGMLQSGVRFPAIFPAALAGVQVLFDGVPSSLLYVQSRQINVQAPFELTVNSTPKIQVSYNGVLSNGTTVRVAAAVPGIFFASYNSKQGAILNEDGTQNSESNPAKRGSLVSVFGTGGGATSPMSFTGGLSPTAPLLLRQPVRALITGGSPAVIQYAGVAPGLTTGLFQVNLFVPMETLVGNQLIGLVIGDTISQYGVTIAIQ